MPAEEDIKGNSWPWLDASIVLVLVVAVILIAVISAGVFDPEPVGDLVDTMALESIQLNGEQHLIQWLEQDAPSDDYSVRLTAALGDGELDSAYGLVLGTEQRYYAAAFSPAGYVALWQQDQDSLEKIINWRTWPHVNQGSEANELWLDVVDGHLISIRTNREILWQGKQPLAGPQIGIWAETFAGPATFDFQSLELFADSPSR